MGIALRIAFPHIFFDFGRQVGAKLAIKIVKKSAPTGIKNMMQIKKAFDASWRRFENWPEPKSWPSKPWQGRTAGQGHRDQVHFGYAFAFRTRTTP